METVCVFCGSAGSSWQEKPDIWRLQCEKCGTVDFSGTVYISKLKDLTDDDKGLWAEYFRENKGKVPPISDSNYDDRLYNLQAKRDGERLRLELNKKK